MRGFAFIWFLGVAPLWSQQLPSREDLLEALSNASATFARTGPGLGAREFLSQRGRRLEILPGKTEARNQVKLPADFSKHEVESAWSLAGTGSLHEVREIKSIDSAPPSAEVRHAMTLDGRSDVTKVLLEDLEHGKLEGAATDFVPLLLLFGTAKQSKFEFRAAGRKKLDGVPMWVLRYRQTGGDDVFTEFRDRSEEHHPAEGEIWFRKEDLLPVRVTMAVEEVLSVHYILRNEAEVNYTPSPFGLAPATVVHRQYLNRDLVIENRFRYTDLTGRPIHP